MSDSLVRQINKTQVMPNALAVWHLGQEGVVIKGNSQRILYFDLYLSHSVEELADSEEGKFKRNFPPPIDPTHITNADNLFITHHHLDHLDPHTIVPLYQASPHMKIVVPYPHQRILLDLGLAPENIIPVKAGEAYCFDNIEVYPLAAMHEQFEQDQEGNDHYVGYVVKMDNICFYHAGDTLVYPELIQQLKEHQIDIAYVPINGRDYFRNRQGIIGNMNYREAIELVSEIQADIVIPCHYDLFEENYENPSHFVDYLYRYYRQQKFKMMVPGELFYYLKTK